MVNAASVQEKIVREILRKLRLATEADGKDDREVICKEIFADVTEELDELAQEQLGVKKRCRFYEVLAPFLNKKWDMAESLLYICRNLWGQPFVFPVYTLLLHQWLLLNKDAGGSEQRQKHINVLISGAKQLFWGDLHSGERNFQPLYHFLATDIVFVEHRKRLDRLPRPSRAGILVAVATFLPYYDDIMHLDLALEVFPCPEILTEEGLHTPGCGADFVMSMLAEALREIKSEQGLLQYLDRLTELGGCPYLQTLRAATRLNLQAELYSLTAVGGPRYVPRSVNAAAFRALDAVFPMGKRFRRIVSLLFRLWLHPTEWPRQAYLATKSSTILTLRSVRFTYRHTLGQIASWILALSRRCRRGLSWFTPWTWWGHFSESCQQWRFRKRHRQ